MKICHWMRDPDNPDTKLFIPHCMGASVNPPDEPGDYGMCTCIRSRDVRRNRAANIRAEIKRLVQELEDLGEKFDKMDLFGGAA